MDYERIEILSKKLYNARIDIRLRTASNILFKLESGILDKDAVTRSSCISTLLSGILNSLSLLLQSAEELVDPAKEPHTLLTQLLQILRQLYVSPAQQIAVEPATQVLDKLYQLKACDLDDKTQQALDLTIDGMCGLRRPQGEDEEAALLRGQQRTAELGAGEGAALAQRLGSEAKAYELASGGGAVGTSGSGAGLFHGAGAVLNSRLSYCGWKFPLCRTTDSDERALFDVEVRVKLRHESAGRELWDVLANFPPQALLLKTNLLHTVLDVVGAPFSQADVEADPTGLHAVTALRWLEALLRKCKQAFAMQMDGALCARVPPSAGAGAWAGTGAGEESVDLEGPDLAGRLAQAMYALRHPVLGAPAVGDTEEAGLLSAGYADTQAQMQMQAQQRHVAALGSLALFPAPSVAGFAFACAAAALPLLQSRHSAAARAVRMLLGTALPMVLEPRAAGANAGRLLEVEAARLQHVLNRLEQMLAFSDGGFSMGAFLRLVFMDEEEEEAKVVRQMAARGEETMGAGAAAASKLRMKERLEKGLGDLQEHSLQLVRLSCLVELFRVMPDNSLLPLAPEAGAGTGGGTGRGRCGGVSA
jgi:hypothetical protein